MASGTGIENSNFASTVLKVIYGIDIKDENDMYLQISEEAVAGAAVGLVPGKFLVDFFPFLRHVPTWFPGAASQRLWVKWMAAVRRLEDVPFEHTKEKMVCSLSNSFSAQRPRAVSPY